MVNSVKRVFSRFRQTIMEYTGFFPDVLHRGSLSHRFSICKKEVR